MYFPPRVGRRRRDADGDGLGREDKEVIGQMVVIMVVMVMMMVMTVVMVVMVVMVMCVCNACCEDKEILLFPDQGTLL